MTSVADKESKAGTASQGTKRPAQEEIKFPDPLQPECRMIIYNISKKANIGNVVRSAVAFGCSMIIVVGKGKINTFGNKNTNKFIRFAFFESLQECKESLKKEGFTIVGVEISPSSKDVTSHPFKGPTAFLMGNEGTGMNPKALAICDQLVYIPQYGSGTASLNVSVAAAIVLHHFSLWAKYPEAGREGEKFVVDESKAAGSGKIPHKRLKTKHEGGERGAGAAAVDTDGDVALLDADLVGASSGAGSAGSASASAESKLAT